MPILNYIKSAAKMKFCVFLRLCITAAIIVFAILGPGVLSKLLLQPSPTYATLGQTTTLICRTSETKMPVRWTVAYVGASMTKSSNIYIVGKLLGSYSRSGRFNVSSCHEGFMNLTIKDVGYKDAGRYTCTDENGFGEQGSADLIILAPSLRCLDNLSSDGVIPAGISCTPPGPDIISFACSLGYRGNIAPRLQWTMHNSGNLTALTDKFTDTKSQITSTVSVIARVSVNNSSVSCHLSTEDFINTEAQESVTWISSGIKILMLQQMKANLTFLDEINEVCPISTNMMNCSHSWSNHTANHTSWSSTSRTSLATQPPTISYTCTVTCSVRGKRCEAAASFDITERMPKPMEKISPWSYLTLAIGTSVILLPIMVAAIIIGYLCRRKKTVLRLSGKKPSSDDKNVSEVSHQEQGDENHKEESRVSLLFSAKVSHLSSNSSHNLPEGNDNVNSQSLDFSNEHLRADTNSTDSIKAHIENHVKSTLAKSGTDQTTNTFEARSDQGTVKSTFYMRSNTDAALVQDNSGNATACTQNEADQLDNATQEMIRSEDRLTTVEIIEHNQYNVNVPDLVQSTLFSSSQRTISFSKNSETNSQFRADLNHNAAPANVASAAQYMSTLTRSQFLKVSEVIPAYSGPESNLDNAYKNILPYLVQKVKMWGVHSLSAVRINNLVHKESDEDWKTEFSGMTPSARNSQVSRIDLFTLLMSSKDHLLTQDLLILMSKFSVAMPLVVSNLHSPIGSYTCLIPLLKAIKIRWEVPASTTTATATNTIIERHLFCLPFKMIVTLRLGSNADKPGKSTILNHIMKKENFFSCIDEPGAEYGKPVTLEGCAEFTWLTQETCGEMLWLEVVQNHYEKKQQHQEIQDDEKIQEELLVLVNFHGDISEHLNFLGICNVWPCSYIIFVMPSATKDDLLQIKTNFTEHGLSESTYFFVKIAAANCEIGGVPTMTQMTTTKSDKNLSKLRLVLRKAISAECHAVTVQDCQIQQFKDCQIEQATMISRNILPMFSTVVNSKGCRGIKQVMKLQSKELSIDDAAKLWGKDDKLRQFVKEFLEIFKKKKDERRKALFYIESELSLRTMKESESARKGLAILRKKLAEHNNEEEIGELQTRINEANAVVDESNCGIEHLFRELGELYRINLSHKLVDCGKAVTAIPEYFAELLLESNWIELFNGDAGVSGKMLIDLFRAVCNKIPDIKIFVVSIIGLQASGKSTLLHALFSGKFAVSAGRCTCGLFMRLVFLDKSLKQSYGFDAFLIIDTEGLAAHEKVNDKQAESKDRLMAAFAIGVSDLTIINILGETVKEITEILQIAMIAMIHLQKEYIASDMLVVQHLRDRGQAQAVASHNNFLKAIKNVLNIIEQKSSEIGVLHIGFLNNFIRRVNSSNFLMQFGPSKDGSSAHAPPSEGYHNDIVNLYETILCRSKKSTTKKTLLQWANIVEEYWNEVSADPFTKHFKTVGDVEKAVDIQKQIANLTKLCKLRK